MNVEIGTEAAQFPEKEYINGIFFTVQVVFALSIKKGAGFLHGNTIRLSYTQKVNLFNCTTPTVTLSLTYPNVQ